MRRTMAVLIVLLVVVVLMFVLFWQSPNGTEEKQGERAGDAESPEGKKGATDLPPVPSRWSETESVLEEEPAGNLRLEGLVLDEHDHPAAGAEVVVDTKPARTTTTDEGGSFFFEKLPGRRFRLEARSENKVGGPVQHRLTETSDPVVIRLRPGGSLEVLVTDRNTRSPVAGAQVELRAMGILSGTTSDDGKVILSGLPTGRATLVAKAAGYATAYREMDVPAPAEAPERVEVALLRGAPVSGRVLDEDRRPVAAATVLAVNVDWFISPTDPGRDGVKTDQQGRFAIRTLAPGGYRLQASHDEYCTASSGIVQVDPQKPPPEVTIIMQSGGSLSGRVVTVSNRPSPWAQVRCARSDGSPFFGSYQDGVVRRTTLAGEDGTFRFGGLPRDRLTVLAVSENGLSSPATVDLGPRPSVEDVVLRLETSHRIAGAVVDPAGEPVHDARVTAVPDAAASKATSGIRLRGPAEVVTDGAGNFEFNNLSEGTYRLRASRSLVSYRLLLQPGVRARTGEEDVRLVVPGVGGTLRGRLLFRDGGSPEQFGVAVGRPPGVPVDTEDGSFEIEGVAPGVHYLFFYGRQFVDVVLQQVEVEEDETTDLGVITVERGRRVSGTVTGTGGAPVEGASVVVALGIVTDGSGSLAPAGTGSDQAMEVRRTLTDETGRFGIDGISPQPRVLVAEKPGEGRSAPVALPEGAIDEEHHLVLKGFGSLHGQVTRNGKPAAFAGVSVRHEGVESFAVQVRAGEDGSYAIDKLDAGPCRVDADVRDGKTGSFLSAGLEVTIRENERQRLDIDIPAGGVTLTVHVEGEGGAGIDVAQVELFSADPSGGESSAHSFWTPSRPAEFADAQPGEARLCVTPVNGDMNDQAFVLWIKKNLKKLRVHCSSLQIQPSPPKQTHRVVVPPMQMLPGE